MLIKIPPPPPTITFLKAMVETYHFRLPMSHFGRPLAVLISTQNESAYSGERTFSAHPSADTQPRVVLSSQHAHGPLGGFEVTTISTLVLSSPLVTDDVTFCHCSKEKPRQDPLNPSSELYSTS